MIRPKPAKLKPSKAINPLKISQMASKMTPMFFVIFMFDSFLDTT
jgi:hypothetical protein